MLEAIVNLILVLIGIGCLILWILSIVESDGKCHMESCDHCVWSGDCEYEKKREDTE